MNPDQLLFSKTHEWVAVEGSAENRIATMGISAFAIEALTDLVYIELPEVGSQVQAEQPFCEVESVKAVSDIYAPIAGEVIEVNQSLSGNLETLSSDPYGEGWIAKIRVAADADLSNLMDHASYQTQCAEESH